MIVWVLADKLFKKCWALLQDTNKYTRIQTSGTHVPLPIERLVMNISCVFYSSASKERWGWCKHDPFHSSDQGRSWLPGSGEGSFTQPGNFPGIPDRQMVRETTTHQDLISGLSGWKTWSPESFIYVKKKEKLNIANWISNLEKCFLA